MNSRPKTKLLHLSSIAHIDLQEFWDRHESIEQAYKRELSDIYSFASWAFGSEGLSELEILVYGDLSRPYGQQNKIFCRSTHASREIEQYTQQTLPFRQVTRDEAYSWEIIERNLEFLTPGVDETTTLFQF